MAVIVPLLNEIKALPILLAALCRLEANELLLVDGGSCDGSVEWLADQQRGQFKLLNSKGGRAAQMNKGASVASSDVLLFLHADTTLPEQALSEIGHGRWGRFDIDFHDKHRANSLTLSLVEFMINARSRLSGIATGDQAIFVERTLFEQIGGFEPIAIMEDVALCKRLKTIERPFCSKLKVRTSARRWQRKGVWKTIFLMWALRFAYFVGVSPQRLSLFYKQVR